VIDTRSTLRDEFGASPDGTGDWIVAISDQSEWGDDEMEEWHEIEWNGRQVLPFFGPLSECPDAVLDLRFGTGYGAPERPVYTVWTTNYIIMPMEYDGATHVDCTNRNPTPYSHGSIDAPPMGARR
jgi:hypothetical protein